MTNDAPPQVLSRKDIEVAALKLAEATLNGKRADVLAAQDEIAREHGQALLYAANTEWPYVMLELMKRRYEANKARGGS